MSFGGKKSKGFNLDCVVGNLSITVVTCCGYVFQGTIEEDDKARAQYGYPVVFPAMTMDYGHGKDDDKDCDKKEHHCDKKEHHCPNPIEVDVKCDNDPKYLCLRLTCPVGFICCDNTSDDDPARIRAVTGTGTAGALRSIFNVDGTVLINIDDIVAIGQTDGCLVTAPFAPPPAP